MCSRLTANELAERLHVKRLGKHSGTNTIPVRTQSIIISSISGRNSKEIPLIRSTCSQYVAQAIDSYASWNLAKLGVFAANMDEQFRLEVLTQYHRLATFN